MSPESGKEVIMMDSSDHSPVSLETLLREYLETVSKNAPKLGSPDKKNSHKEMDLLDGLGQYLCLVAQACSQLTDGLVLSPHLDKLVVKAHEESRLASRLTDISEIVNMDIEVTKLNNIRTLTEKFSRDVQDIWNATAPK